MIRVRLTRRRTVGSRVVHLVRSGSTPVEPPLVVEGVLVVVSDGPGGALVARPAASFEEGIQYDAPLALLLDQVGDSQSARLFIASPLRLITTSGPPDYVPLRVETRTSEYLVLVL